MCGQRTNSCNRRCGRMVASAFPWLGHSGLCSGATWDCFLGSVRSFSVTMLSLLAWVLPELGMGNTSQREEAGSVANTSFPSLRLVCFINSNGTKTRSTQRSRNQVGVLHCGSALAQAGPRRHGRLPCNHAVVATARTFTRRPNSKAPAPTVNDKELSASANVFQPVASVSPQHRRAKRSRCPTRSPTPSPFQTRGSCSSPPHSASARNARVAYLDQASPHGGPNSSGNAHRL